MNIALYQSASGHPEKLQANGNAGLFFFKFFNQYDNGFSKVKEPKKDEKPSPKHKFLQMFTELSDNGTAITNFALRQIQLTEALGGVWFIASNYDASPFVTGTGNSHPVENGFLWHHTLSVPYMQGSAIKGIMRSWLENQLGYGLDEDDNHSELKRYFGSETKASSDNQAGNLIFFDALPIAQPKLKVEIMTPHMGDYYADEGKTAPADWHSPNPIPFLAVEHISLLFCIAPRNGKIDAAELEQLSTALQKALANIGAGAKTQTGFGRLTIDESSEAYRLFRNELKIIKKQASMASKTPEDFLLDEVAEQVEIVNGNKNSSTEKNLHVKFRELYDKQMENKPFTHEHVIKLKDLMIIAEKFGISKVDQIIKKISRDLLS